MHALCSHIQRSVKTFSFRRFLCRVPQHAGGLSNQLHYLLAQNVSATLGLMHFIRPPCFQPWNVSSLLVLAVTKTLYGVATLTGILEWDMDMYSACLFKHGYVYCMVIQTWIRISHGYSNMDTYIARLFKHGYVYLMLIQTWIRISYGYSNMDAYIAWLFKHVYVYRMVVQTWIRISHVYSNMDTYIAWLSKHGYVYRMLIQTWIRILHAYSNIFEDYFDYVLFSCERTDVTNPK
jgi:hypothetical protein